MLAQPHQRAAGHSGVGILCAALLRMRFASLSRAAFAFLRLAEIHSGFQYTLNPLLEPCPWRSLLTAAQVHAPTCHFRLQ